MNIEARIARLEAGLTDPTAGHLDALWERVNVLGVANPASPYEEGYHDAINAALAEIEKLGGMDPFQRRQMADPEITHTAAADAALNG